ncbi:MAG: acetate--CoA ligase [Candidatus Aenigmatarchaeota archaeon]
MKNIIKKRPRVKPNLEDYDSSYKKFNWKSAEKEIEFFGKKLNVAYNAVDRHAKTWRKNKIALYWDGNDREEKYTFQELSDLSNKFANVLKKLKIKKGDRVFIFLPRVPELYVAFLGILKTGAIAGTLFSAFGPTALKDRLQNSGATALITNNDLKGRVYEIIKDTELKHMIIVDGGRGKEIDYHKAMAKTSRKFNIAKMRRGEPAFMLYTSGTTGKPKGVVHCHQAILHEHMTAKWVLDFHDDDVYWCTADPGWVTGIAYEIIGSLSNGVSSVVYEGKFDPEKWYSTIEKYRVTIWYTAPTAIRMLAAAGNVHKKYDLSSLRHLCSVGEPLNPEPIRWSIKTLKKPFHDNWWQTETGGILIANYPSMPIKPGSMGKPIPGVTAGIVDDNGKELPTGKEGNLAIRPGWPSMMKRIWKRPKKYREYFNNGWYISGDRAYKDKDGYFWFIGRADDVIKTSGERVGPFEVESALIEHPAVVESGVIGKPDPVRGEIIKAFIVLAKGYKPGKRLEGSIKEFVKKRLAGHAYPREIEFVDSLPKTQSGKIVRRFLKAKELGLPTGDTSTLEKF